MAYLQSPLVMNCVCMDFTSFTGFLVIPAVPYVPALKAVKARHLKRVSLKKIIPM